MFGYKKLKRKIAALENILGIIYKEDWEMYQDLSHGRLHDIEETLKNLKEKKNNTTK